MTDTKNTQVLLASRPVGLPKESDWNIAETEIPNLQQGECLIKIKYISLDPAMRGWVSDKRSYLPPVEIGAVMRAGTVGEIVKSKHPEFKEGDTVVGWNGVQSYAISNGEGLYKVDPSIMPMEKYLSVVGMPGFTAYFGLLDVGKPKEGETVLVSGAAGAVGSIVGQIAKIKGCRVVGIAGGQEKCAYLINDLGFDAAIDYKNESVKRKIRELCPEGIDIYFDNVGGDILEAALNNLKMKARILICGGISQYNATEMPKGPANYLNLIVFRARMEGFLVMDYASEYKKAGMEMGMWMMQGKLKSKEFVIDGIENFPSAILRLFSGDKRGKLMIKV